MTSKTYDFLIFIGRFQPLHNGHLSVVEHALKISEKVIVLCGSAHQPRTYRNPWTVEEREKMIRDSLQDQDQQRVLVAPLMDIMYNDESWVKNVQATVNGLVTAHFGLPHKQPRIALVGHSKDQSSYYLNLFPQWQAESVDNFKGLSATPIREYLFSANSAKEYLERAHTNSHISEAVKKHLLKFSESEDYQNLKGEHEFIAKYKQAWSAAPYAPTFVTVDAIVVQSGHVLMVERKARPGKGLLALPGGFLDQDEKLLDACLRELREETRLKVPSPVLKGSVKSQRVFDDPYRSSRGRTITHAFYIELEPNKDLPKVKGSDDAKKAIWVPLADLDPTKIFEDHYFIIKEMTGM